MPQIYIKKKINKKLLRIDFGLINKLFIYWEKKSIKIINQVNFVSINIFTFKQLAHLKKNLINLNQNLIVLAAISILCYSSQILRWKRFMLLTQSRR